MRILLTGATGYIGKRLLPVLLKNGHEVTCCVRDKNRFHYTQSHRENLHVIEVDFLKSESLRAIPKKFEVAFYLIHSMSSSSGNFEVLESESANNFTRVINQTSVRQVIYLSGIINSNQLSKHLSSRHNVEKILSKGTFKLTTIRAGIIVGSGSASFEIIRDLIEKLPVMVTPKWLHTKSQPIGIKNVIDCLYGVLNTQETFDKSYDIGGPDILSYKQMLLQFARVRKLKRTIWVVPVMTPRLSSYWLYFVTSTSYKLAVNLVNSMKIEIICKNDELLTMLDIKPVSYKQAIISAFLKIEQNDIISSWKDSLASGILNTNLSSHVQVPVFGCYKDIRHTKASNLNSTLTNIWSIGGEKGWYYANWLWGLRGFIDKMVGGVGLRRGRTHPTELSTGDALDFWRVLLADKSQGRLLLYAEMKLPGEAWLEFNIDKNNLFTQTATFRPTGLLGRLYWFSVLPLHTFIFGGMIRRISV